MVVLAAVSFLVVLCIVETLDTSQVLLLCSEETSVSNNSMGRVKDVIHDVLEHTANTKAGNNYYAHQLCYRQEEQCDGFQELYGHGECTVTLSAEDCKTCLGEANRQLFDQCTERMGAQIQLMDCRLRYEKYDFTDD
ncbi:hypothetical protein MLD38_035740 [Melastoma candidum]|uniref:Uncharacterized protein n=1 Tax=Melastoma candidum TaxID=119954 RepID=A0ACB9LJE0_9MYRT|nr:hypothetical protein MLD38_035740 [Melastoma candidum]